MRLVQPAGMQRGRVKISASKVELYLDAGAVFTIWPTISAELSWPDESQKTDPLADLQNALDNSGSVRDLENALDNVHPTPGIDLYDLRKKSRS